MRNLIATTLLGLVAGATFAAPVTPPAVTAEQQHAADVEQWRRERVERLQRPDGWLALVGLHWFEPGTHTIGRASDNAIVIAAGPDRLGTVTLAAGGTPTVTLDPASNAVMDPPAEGSNVPGRIRFAGDGGSVEIIERSGRYALRVRDPGAHTRSAFAGIDYYPVDLGFRFEAKFEPHPPGKTIEIASVINTLEPMPNPGRVVFEKDGRQYSLEAVDEGDGELFLIFADRTNGKETYGPGRFLYASPPVQGQTIVDFNRAYNPPCAFTAHSTCPLPPPENRLDLAVTAGEKKYKGPTQ